MNIKKIKKSLKKINQLWPSSTNSLNVLSSISRIVFSNKPEILTEYVTKVKFSSC